MLWGVVKIWGYGRSTGKARSLDQVGECTGRAASGDGIGSCGDWSLGLLEASQVNGKARQNRVRTDSLLEETP